LSRVCAVAAVGGLLFGYDTAVISGAIGFLQTHFELNPAMKGWTASSALAGCVIGAVFAGVLNDRLGRRKVLILSAIAFLVSAIGTALPNTLTTFIIFRFIGGMGVGAASMTGPLYIAEISPARIRGRMVSWNQFAIIFGIVAVYFVNYFIVHIPDDPTWNVTTGWRWMFGSEAIPATLFLLLLLFVPESPRWLTKQGREDKALAILSQVEGSDYARSEVDAIKANLSEESNSIGQLLQPGLRIAIVIGIVLAVIQQVCGINVFLYYGPEIFKTISSSKVDVALLQQIVVGAVMLLFTVTATWTVDRIGRKPLMIFGFFGMLISLTGLGVAAYMNQISAWTLIFILGFIACFALSAGPVTWVILSEIFPTKVRGRAMATATVCLWFANLAISQTFPMMDENAWLVEKFNHSFPFWVYAIFCLASVIFIWRCVPETKGKTLEQIEKQWLKD